MGIQFSQQHSFEAEAVTKEKAETFSKDREQSCLSFGQLQVSLNAFVFIEWLV